MTSSGLVGPKPCLVDLEGAVSPIEVLEAFTGGRRELLLFRRLDGTHGVLKPRAPDDSAGLALRIEEQVLRQLDHPHVVRVWGGVDGPRGRLLALERLFPHPLRLLSHPEVRPRLPRDPGGQFYPCPPRLALSLTCDLLAALEHLQRRGFAHLDVKPDNLLLRIPTCAAQARPATAALAAQASRPCTTGVLVDFEGARSLEWLEALARGDVDREEAPARLTPSYSPPEALRRDGRPPRLHPSHDVYGAALVLYASVSGCAPYEHLRIERRGMDQLLQLKGRERDGRSSPITLETLARAPGVGGTLARDLFRFIEDCTDPDPAARPTAAAARARLEDLRAALWTRDAAAPLGRSGP